MVLAARVEHVIAESVKDLASDTFSRRAIHQLQFGLGYVDELLRTWQELNARASAVDENALDVAVGGVRWHGQSPASAASRIAGAIARAGRARQ
jgi:hypothetical protein